MSTNNTETNENESRGTLGYSKYKLFSNTNIGDSFIWGVYVLLCIISIIESYSASSREITGTGWQLLQPIIKHAVMLAIGTGIVIGVSHVHFRKFQPWIILFAGASILAMLYVLFFGETINGARRAFSIFGISVQPAEMAKLSIVTLTAFILARTQKVHDVKNSGVAWCAVFVGLYGGLLCTQGLTNTFILMFISLSMMLIGGMKVKKIIVVVLVYCVFGGGFFYIRSYNKDKQEQFEKEKVEQVSQNNGTTFTQDLGKDGSRMGTWQKRIFRFLDSESLIDQPINSINEQEIRSRMAQAHGGITGVGPGNSRERCRLPLAFSDYIYSIIVEETGLIGGIFVLILYLSLLARAGMIARRCKRAFPALLILGCAVMITFQALVHIAINVGAMPVSGQPLPLISKGGTSIMFICLAFGIMLSVSRYAVQTDNKKDIKTEENNLPEGLRASNPT